MVKSFFDPSWPDLGVLGVYGRWGGVNWVWSLLHTIYLIEFISHPARVWLGDLDFRTYRRGH